MQDEVLQVEGGTGPRSPQQAETVLEPTIVQDLVIAGRAVSRLMVPMPTLILMLRPLAEPLLWVMAARKEPVPLSLLLATVSWASAGRTATVQRKRGKKVGLFHTLEK